jgi:hypothetical protein
MAALMGKDVELPAGSPCRDEDVTGVHPTLAVPAKFYLECGEPVASRASPGSRFAGVKWKCASALLTPPKNS